MYRKVKEALISQADDIVPDKWDSIRDIAAQMLPPQNTIIYYNPRRRIYRFAAIALSLCIVIAAAVIIMPNLMKNDISSELVIHQSNPSIQPQTNNGQANTNTPDPNQNIERENKKPSDPNQNNERKNEKPSSSNQTTDHGNEKPSNSGHTANHSNKKPSSLNQNTNQGNEKPSSSNKTTDYGNEKPSSLNPSTDQDNEKPSSLNPGTDQVNEKPSDSTQNTENGNETSVKNDEISPAPPLVYSPIWEMFSEIALNGIKYCPDGAIVNESEICELIGATTSIGYDVYDNNKKYTVNCKVYSLKSISADCAVAVQFEGCEDYYYFFLIP